MRSTKSVGRIIGLLFLVQVLLAPAVYTQFGLIGPVIGIGPLRVDAPEPSRLSVGSIR